MSKKGGKLTKEEELLLQDFSRHVSVRSSALFYGSGFVAALTPIWLFWRIHHMDLSVYWIAYILVSLGSAWLIAFAYKNTKFGLKHRIALKREEGISRDINKQLQDDKKVTKKEKDERILWKKNEIADYEATTYSLFYNNLLFLFVTVVLSFFVLRSAAPLANYGLSTLGAAGLVALLSTGSK
ncbi:translocon-associated protein subunit gamma-like [Paramacrobiotus metropolitanus]|uniref:translocon-associated protein subunit gamma-like n=1 Tax=Paramacrobiotus metropolitanus TaxID=2943436 RepID=UPI0024460BBF|nr:translocon-associated protein subunit gamma-like [Paramacrobiotus metropolitanus]